MNFGQSFNMLKLTKWVLLRDRFTPIIGRLVLQNPSCCLTKNVNPIAAYSMCWKKFQKRSAEVSEVKPFAPQFTVSHCSTLQGHNILVYHGNLTPQIKMVKIFSLLSSVTGLGAQPLLYHHASEFGGTGVIIGVATFVGFFTFVTPVLLHLLTRKYVTDIHHNSKTGAYTASLLTFFLRVKKVTFQADDVLVPDVPGLFTTFKVKGSSLFVDPRLFEDPDHYGKIMGYDKPIDFLLKKDISSDGNEEIGTKVTKK